MNWATERKLFDQIKAAAWPRHSGLGQGGLRPSVLGLSRLAAGAEIAVKAVERPVEHRDDGREGHPVQEIFVTIRSIWRIPRIMPFEVQL